MSKKYLKILISTSLILIISILCFLKFTESLEKPQNISKEEIRTNDYIIKSQIKPKLTLGINVSLKVLDQVYTTEIKNNASVYDVMVKIKNENKNFYFKYKEYPAIGIFINEINGEKGSSGKYWIYYVNDKEASVGVSNYIIKEGDVITFQQE